MKTNEFIFLKEEEGGWNAIHSSTIETLNVSDCYDGNGQQISNADAGDNIVSLDEEEAEWLNTHDEDGDEVEKDEDDTIYKVGDNLSAYEDRGMFSAFVFNFPDREIEKETCEGFTYWDGHNFQTITVSVDNGEPTHYIEDDEETLNLLNEAVELAETENGEKKAGYENWKTEKMEINESPFQEAWEKNFITEI